ncbi:hypothetical protein H2248_004128 [Termitomyces sp. 'cryptogamus']|nr:hypothetical protein H2248_004128 [Termitomyces sp. 'cryptogamus']
MRFKKITWWAAVRGTTCIARVYPAAKRVGSQCSCDSGAAEYEFVFGLTNGTPGTSNFNIWRALVDSIPTTYISHFLDTDESTAVNHGQDNLKVTWWRGNKRTFFASAAGFNPTRATALTSLRRFLRYMDRFLAQRRLARRHRPLRDIFPFWRRATWVRE